MKNHDELLARIAARSETIYPAMSEQLRRSLISPNDVSKLVLNDIPELVAIVRKQDAVLTDIDNYLKKHETKNGIGDSADMAINYLVTQIFKIMDNHQNGQ